VQNLIPFVLQPEPSPDPSPAVKAELAGAAQQRLHGRREGVVQGVHAVGLVPADERVLRVERVQEQVLDLVQPRRLAQRPLLRERRL